MAQKYVYWNREVSYKIREKWGGSLLVLSKEWAVVTERLRRNRTRQHLYHTSCKKQNRTRQGKGKRSTDKIFLTFERKRWFPAGTLYLPTPTGKVRRTCMFCKARVPVSLRVLFELKG